MSEQNNQVWFVTGAGKGLGAAITREALEKGHKVVAAVRNPEAAKKTLGEWPHLFVVRLDLTDASQIQSAVTEALAKFGRIDVLVNNAGYGLLGYFEELSDAVIRRQMETNVFGPMNLTREILPIMREQRSGWIINVSSTSGIKSVEGGSIYSASKFALEGWTEGLQIELKAFGIRCLLVEPGAFRTDFFNQKTSMAFGDKQVDDYRPQREIMEERFLALDTKQAGNPVQLAKALMTTLDSATPPLRLLCGKYACQSIAHYLQDRRAELDIWRSVGESTDFAD